MILHQFIVTVFYQQATFSLISLIFALTDIIFNMRAYHTSQRTTIPISAMTPTQRLYSLEQVRSWCESMLDSRLKYLSLQINENNQTIRQLKQRLLQNERELQRKQRLIQSLQRPSGSSAISIPHPAHNDLSRKLLSSQLQEKLTTINSLTRQLSLFRNTISGSSQQSLTTYQSKMDSWLNENLNTLKEYIRKKCALVKEHNSQYWMKIRKWAVVFEQRLGRVDQSVGVLGEETQKWQGGTSRDMFGVYRIKNVNARFKEIEEAVGDLEEGWRLASEVQEELREILWNNDERDFVEGEGEGVYVDYEPEMEFAGQDLPTNKQTKISQSSPKKSSSQFSQKFPVQAKPAQQYQQTQQQYKQSNQFQQFKPQPPQSPQISSHQSTNPNQVRKAVSTQSTRPMRQKPTLLHQFHNTKSLISSVEQQSSRREQDSSLARQTKVTPKHQPSQLPRKTGAEVKFRTAPNEFKEVYSEPQGEYFSPHYEERIYREAMDISDQVVSSPKFGPKKAMARVEQAQTTYGRPVGREVPTPKAPEPGLTTFAQKTVSTFGKEAKEISKSSISISIKPEPPSSPKIKMPATVKNSIAVPPREQPEVESTRPKTLSERFFSWFGRSKSKDQSVISKPISTKPEPPSSPQKLQPKVLPEPVPLPKPEPNTTQTIPKSFNKSFPSNPTSNSTIKPNELSTSIKNQLSEQQSPKLIITKPLSSQPAAQNSPPLPQSTTSTTKPLAITLPLDEYQFHSLQPPERQNDSFSSMQDNDSPTKHAAKQLPKFTTVEDVRARLEKLIELDKIAPPIPAYLDDYKFLKTKGKLYLFDVGGDMIRMSEYIYKELCKEGLLKPMND